MIHESVEAPNGEMIMLEYSTPPGRLEQIRNLMNEFKDNDTK